MSSKLIKLNGLIVALALGLNLCPAQALEVIPLETPSVQDIDAQFQPQKLQQALEKYSQAFNAFLEELKPLDDQQAIAKVLDPSAHRWAILEKKFPLRDIEVLIKPLLDEYDDKMYVDGTPGPTPAEDRLIELLHDAGIDFSIENTNHLICNAVFIREHIRFSQDYLSFLGIVNEQPESLIFNDGIKQSIKWVSEYAQAWEQYIDNASNDFLKLLAFNRYKLIMHNVLFCEWPNSPAFDPQTNKMGKYWALDLKNFVEDNQGSFTASLIDDYLSMLESRDYKRLSSDKEQRYLERIDKNFNYASLSAVAVLPTITAGRPILASEAGDLQEQTQTDVDFSFEEQNAPATASEEEISPQDRELDELIASFEQVRHEPLSTADMMDKYDALFKQADGHLNLAYKKAMSALENRDPQRKEDLRNSQRAWLKFNNKLIEDAATGFGGGGTIYGLMAVSSKFHIWVERARYLYLVARYLEI